MKELRLALKIIKTLTKDRIRYPARLLVDTVAIVARCVVLLLLYRYAFRFNGGVINGTTFAIAAWSMFLYFSFSAFRLRDISRMIMSDVQSGNVETLFNKPVSYLAYRIWWQIGSDLYSYLVILSIGAILMVLLIGMPETMSVAIFWPTILMVSIGGIALTLILYAIVGMAAFWIQDISPLFWLVDKFVMILGGSYLPVALFPNYMLKIAQYSPFGATLFVTHTVYESWQSDWLFLFGMQIFWLIALWLIIYYIFTQARRKVSVNGG